MAATAVVLLFRVAVSAFYAATSEAGRRDRKWEILFVIGSTGAALVWTLLGVFLFPDSSPQHQLVVIFVLAGVSAAGMPALASCRSAVIPFLAIIILPMVHRIIVHISQRTPWVFLRNSIIWFKL